MVFVIQFYLSLVAFCHCFSECWTYSDVRLLPIIQMRWDFYSCGITGRNGPTQADCDKSYKGSTLEGQVQINRGVQQWMVPTSGLYLITVKAPSGAASIESRSGRGASLTAEFRLVQGEKLNILVGQQSDYVLARSANSIRGVGGSGGSFVIRDRDSYVMLIAGGGSSAAGYNPSSQYQNQSDGAFTESGNVASDEMYLWSLGGKEVSRSKRGEGGSRGASSDVSSSGGGAGLFGNGEISYLRMDEETADLNPPQPAVSFYSEGVGDYGPAVGGFFSLQESGVVYTNNGGFGGGGSGSVDGGSGGGGGYCGGSGGPKVGWGGGGGSVNNGETKVSYKHHYGRGEVTISYIGQSCCGPFVVYTAMSFIAGILFTTFIIFILFSARKRKKAAM